MRRALFLALAIMLSSCTALDVATHSVRDDPVKLAGGTYQLDPHHWSVIFDVDHFGYSRFVTRFDKIEAKLDAVPNAPEKSRVAVTIKAASVNTNDPALDTILTGPDFFDAVRFPDITFVSTALARTGPKTADMTGLLTLRNQSHPVTLKVTFNGGAPDPLTGLDTLGFSAEGRFDRAQWGLGNWWPAVGTEVHVSIQAEFVKPKSD
tara:strand:+ start:4968 stop:5588 length:621 start_codon:yes stop_codon:yes gene_type:complete